MREAIDCAERVQRDLSTTVALLRDAEAQLAHADPAARRDAAQAVVALEQRLDTLASALRACVPEEARPGVRTVEQAPTGAAAAVGHRNDLRAIHHELELGGDVTVVVGRRVDGFGELDEGTLRSGFHRAAGSFARCYDQYLEHGSFAEGEVGLSFWVGADGRVRRPALDHAAFGDARFERCLTQAALQLRLGPPRGGEAQYAYTLRFGASH